MKDIFILVTAKKANLSSAVTANKIPNSTREEVVLALSAAKGQLLRLSYK